MGGAEKTRQHRYHMGGLSPRKLKSLFFFAGRNVHLNSNASPNATYIQMRRDN
jgi:hypothetical protein